MSVSADLCWPRIETFLAAILDKGAPPFLRHGFACHLWPSPDPYYRDTARPLTALRCAPPAPATLHALLTHEPAIGRIELIAEAWPALASALRSSGLLVQEIPAMVLAACPVAGSPPELLRADAGLEVLYHHLVTLDRALGGLATLDRREAQNLAHGLADERIRVAVRYDDTGVLIGTAALVCAGQVAELQAVWTAPEHRRRGIADELCRALLAGWLIHPDRLAWLGASNPAAARLYRAMGFREIGTYLIAGLPMSARD